MPTVLRTLAEQKHQLDQSWEQMPSGSTWFHFSLQSALTQLLHPESFKMFDEAKPSVFALGLGRRPVMAWSERQKRRAMFLATLSDEGFSNFLATARRRAQDGCEIVRVQAIPDEIWEASTAYLEYLDELLTSHNIPAANERDYNVRYSELSGLHNALVANDIDRWSDVLLFGDRFLYLTSYDSSGIAQRIYFDASNAEDQGTIRLALEFRNAVLERMKPLKPLESKMPKQMDMRYALGKLNPGFRPSPFVQHQFKRFDFEGVTHFAIGNGPDICIVDLNEVIDFAYIAEIDDWLEFIAADQPQLFNLRTIVMTQDIESAKRWADATYPNREYVVADTRFSRDEANDYHRLPERVNRAAMTTFSTQQVTDVLSDYVDPILNLAMKAMRNWESLPKAEIADAAMKLFSQVDFELIGRTHPHVVSGQAAKELFDELAEDIVGASRDFAVAIATNQPVLANEIFLLCDTNHRAAMARDFDGSDNAGWHRWVVAMLERPVSLALGSSYWNQNALRPSVFADPAGIDPFLGWSGGPEPLSVPWARVHD